MSQGKNTKRVGHIDCPGGGQVWVDGTTLYVGHMRAPTGTSIYDISDPAKPQLLSRLELPNGWHSHKVRVANDIMVVNHERLADGAQLNRESMYRMLSDQGNPQLASLSAILRQLGLRLAVEVQEPVAA